jgi:glycerate 2-kinase
MPVRALLCPASLKGFPTARVSAAALARGLQGGGASATELPVGDGGEGTADAFAAALGGEWREAEVSDPLGRPRVARWLVLPDGRAIVEAAAAIGLPLLAPGERAPLLASSRGLGELVLAALAESPSSLLVGLGGSATVDGGSGLREVLDALPVATVALCDVGVPLADAARLFGPQKGASPGDVAVLERRLAGVEELRPYGELPGAGAAGGLGAALASLGAELVPGAATVLDQLGFDELLSGHDLVVTGEGAVDGTTATGKAPGEVARRAHAAGTRCVVFGGRVQADVPGAKTVALSGDPARAEVDLVELGRNLAHSEGTQP